MCDCFIFFHMIVCLHVIKSINIPVTAAMLVGWLVGSLDAYPNDHRGQVGFKLPGVFRG